LKDPDLLAYIERVEREFFRSKARPGTLSPSDFARAEAWYRSGVPVEAALSAIQRAFETQARGRDSDTEEVNSLAYCEGFLGEGRRRRRIPS
jgi:hypothetical protein